MLKRELKILEHRDKTNKVLKRTEYNQCVEYQCKTVKSVKKVEEIERKNCVKKKFLCDF